MFTRDAAPCQLHRRDAARANDAHPERVAARRTLVETMHRADNRRIAAALESRVGQSHDQAHVAASVVALWREIERQLMPIIGARGVAALYGRTLYVTSRTHPWLGDVPEGVQESMDLSTLYAAVVAQPREIGIDGGRALFTVFHGLLESMVGAVLTERLLRDVMAPSSSGDPAQDTQ